MPRPKHIIREMSDTAITQINENFEGVYNDLSLDNFSGSAIDTTKSGGTVIINKTIVQAPIVTIEGSDLDGAYLKPASVEADKISVDSLTAISSDLGKATSGSLVVGSGNKLWLNDENDGGLEVGGTDKATAPFRVDSEGNLEATNATVTGQVYASGGTLAGITQANVDVGPAGNVRGGQTDYETGTGFFLGKSGGAYKFSVGNPSTNELTWDGSNLRILGNIALSSAIALFGYTAGNLPVVPASVGYNVPSGIE